MREGVKMPLPDWLCEQAANAPKVTRGRRSWISKAIGRLILLTAPAGERRRGVVRLDARAAVAVFVILIVSTTFLKSPTALVVSLVISIVLASLVGASRRTLVAGVLGVGGLTAAAMLPAATSFVTPGRAIFELCGVAFTSQGTLAASQVLIRTTACLVFGIGLFASNPVEELFSALRWFRAPGVFVAVLLMTYRYLQVIARAALDDHFARKSRVPDESNLGAARQWAGERVGALFVRSKELGEEVHLAMISRGFDGVWMPAPTSRVRVVDLAWVVFAAVVGAALIVLDRKTGLL